MRNSCISLISNSCLLDRAVAFQHRDACGQAVHLLQTRFELHDKESETLNEYGSAVYGNIGVSRLSGDGRTSSLRDKAQEGKRYAVDLEQTIMSASSTRPQ